MKLIAPYTRVYSASRSLLNNVFELISEQYWHITNLAFGVWPYGRSVVKTAVSYFEQLLNLAISVCCIQQTGQMSQGLPDLWATCFRIWDTLDNCPAPRWSHTKDCLAIWKPAFVLRCCTSWSSWGPPFCQASECEPMPSWPLADCWVRETLMWQTVSDCRSRLSGCLLVMNCCALQSSIFVWIPSEVLKLKVFTSCSCTQFFCQFFPGP